MISEPPDITHPPLKIKLRGAGIDCLMFELCHISTPSSCLVAWVVIAYLKRNILFLFCPFQILSGILSSKITFETIVYLNFFFFFIVVKLIKLLIQTSWEILPYLTNFY